MARARFRVGGKINVFERFVIIMHTTMVMSLMMQQASTKLANWLSMIAYLLDLRC